MNKKTIQLIWDLNSLYDTLFNSWSNHKWDEIIEIQNKLKLIKNISKNLEEQKRWFLKSKLDYSKSWFYILDNISKNYVDLHKWVTSILLEI